MTEKEMKLYRMQVKKKKKIRTRENYDSMHEYNIDTNFSEYERE